MIAPVPVAEDTALFLEIGDLEIATRALVDSLLIGGQRSVRSGAGAEFERHREYQRGDDLRHINWRLYSRSRRLYIKEFRAETNMPVHLIVDGSASMRTGQPYAKYPWAIRAAAAMAWIALQNRDAAGAALAVEGAGEWLPPRMSSLQFQDIIGMFENHVPNGAGSMAAALGQLSDVCRRRGVVLVCSDFVDNEDEILSALETLVHQGHEVLALQVLSPDEASLPKTGDFFLCDPETGHRSKASFEATRDSYNAAIREWLVRMENNAAAAGISWISVTTADSLTTTLRALLQNQR